MEKEWENEPSEQYGVESGFAVYALRHKHLGHWCGYVSLPPTHPLHGKGYNDIDVDVHGGLTYAEEGKNGAWDFGFDCAHSGDLCPLSRREIASMGDGSTYRNLEYVKGQITSLAEQLYKLGAQ